MLAEFLRNSSECYCFRALSCTWVISDMSFVLISPLYRGLPAALAHLCASFDTDGLHRLRLFDEMLHSLDPQ